MERELIERQISVLEHAIKTDNEIHDRHNKIDNRLIATGSFFLLVLSVLTHSTGKFTIFDCIWASIMVNTILDCVRSKARSKIDHKFNSMEKAAKLELLNERLERL
ncbi:MAG: hypothetical protein ACRCX2_03420 [Paraclostridium sp.]